MPRFSFRPSQFFGALRRVFSSEAIPNHCVKLYFESVRADYRGKEGLPGSRTDAKAAEIAEELEKRFDDKLLPFTMTHALLYERARARLIPLESLKRKVLTDRGRYRRML